MASFYRLADELQVRKWRNLDFFQNSSFLAGKRRVAAWVAGVGNGLDLLFREQPIPTDPADSQRSRYSADPVGGDANSLGCIACGK